MAACTPGLSRADELLAAPEEVERGRVLGEGEGEKDFGGARRRELKFREVLEGEKSSIRGLAVRRARFMAEVQGAREGPPPHALAPPVAKDAKSPTRLEA